MPRALVNFALMSAKLSRKVPCANFSRSWPACLAGTVLPGATSSALPESPTTGPEMTDEKTGLSLMRSLRA